MAMHGSAKYDGRAAPRHCALHCCCNATDSPRPRPGCGVLLRFIAAPCWIGGISRTPPSIACGSSPRAWNFAAGLLKTAVMIIGPRRSDRTPIKDDFRNIVDARRIDPETREPEWLDRAAGNTDFRCDTQRPTREYRRCDAAATILSGRGKGRACLRRSLCTIGALCGAAVSGRAARADRTGRT